MPLADSAIRWAFDKSDSSTLSAIIPSSWSDRYFWSTLLLSLDSSKIIVPKRKNMVPEDLIKFWIGHAPKTVTDEHSKLKHDVQFRRDVAERVGLGFMLKPQLYPVVPQIFGQDVLEVVEINGAP